MPIRPENKARYPKNWPAISRRVRDRSGGQCECEGECGLRHYVNGRGKQLDVPPELWIEGAPGSRCRARNSKRHPVTGSIVVLTVAHLDRTPENCADGNLKAFCQRCHLRYDMAKRVRDIKERRRAKFAVGDLFLCSE